MKNKKLTSEIKEFLKSRGLDITQENLIMLYSLAELQIKEDTYWSPCEDCDNPSCRKKEDFPIWFCEDNR